MRPAFVYGSRGARCVRRQGSIVYEDTQPVVIPVDAGPSPAQNCGPSPRLSGLPPSLREVLGTPLWLATISERGAWGLGAII